MKKGVLILAHGSRRAQANEAVEKMVKRFRQSLASDMIELGFMELAEPDIPQGIQALKRKGCTDIFAYPYFLINGNHKMRDIPRIIRTALRRSNGVRLTLGGPLCENQRLYRVMEEDIEEKLPHASSKKKLLPQEIEDESMRIIQSKLNGPACDGAGIKRSKEELAVIKRAIHTTGDFDYALNLRFYPDAARRGIEALGSGCDIITDVKMVQAGIIKSLGNAVICNVDDEDVLRESVQKKETRSSLGIASLKEKLNGSVIAIGNAPTALLKVIELVEKNKIRPALIIGVPVGFVGAAESKLKLMDQKKVPCITSLGRKGGSTVAVAIVNALIKLAKEGK